MPDLARMKCVACRPGAPHLSQEEIVALLPEVPEWQALEIEGVRRLRRVFKFKDFTQAMAFTNQIAAIAEAEDHHPLIITEWRRVTVEWWTHVIKGLHRNDFIMAARADRLIS